MQVEHIPLVDETEGEAQDEADETLRSRAHDVAGQDEHAVPTEMLEEDVTIELPTDFHEMSIASLIATRPRPILASIYFVALLSTIWVLLTPGDKFSVSEDLFIARHDPAVASFYGQAHLETASMQLAPGYSYPTNRRHQRRLNYPSTDMVTLVYERRGLGSRNVLGLRQLKTIHDFEQRLWEWSRASGACCRSDAGSDSQACLPMDSLLSYLYPRVETAPDTKSGEEGLSKLHFDGRMRVEHNGPLSTCADPPFSSHDVASTLEWLSSQQLDGSVTCQPIDG